MNGLRLARSCLQKSQKKEGARFITQSLMASTRKVSFDRFNLQVQVAAHGPTPSIRESNTRRKMGKIGPTEDYLVVVSFFVFLPLIIGVLALTHADFIERINVFFFFLLYLIH
jgi:hypothetical protein